MLRQEQGDDNDYEVSQEQLDAVDRMLEELDMEEQFDRAPAAFQIVERFEQQRQQEQAMSMSRSIGDHVHIPGQRNGHLEDKDMDRNEENPDQFGMQLDGESTDEEGYGDQPIGYIPLDQAGDDGDSDEDEEEEDSRQDEYHEMQSEDEEQQSGTRHEREDHGSNRGRGDDSINDDDDDDDDDGQGYDGYLHSPLPNGNVPVPVIPSAIEIEIEQNDAAAEKIPEEDLQTIAQVMSSFSLPTPDWARSIPEERWLPKIVQQATAFDRDHQ